MKPYLSLLLFLFLSFTAFCAVDDPVKDYLSNRQNAYQRGDDKFYADDKVFVLDLDLMGNGQSEKLVSSSLDHDGKAGNLWTVYSKEGNSWKRVGTMTFRTSGFYLGKIDELGGQYGLVAYFPSGAQEGSFLAYIFNGSSIQETKIGEVVHDPVTRELKGTNFFGRYSGDKMIKGDNVIKTMPAKEVAAKYSIKIESKNYIDALRDSANGVQTNK
jgi:hypothetical protein